MGGEEHEGLPRVIPNKMLETDEVKTLRGASSFPLCQSSTWWRTGVKTPKGDLGLGIRLWVKQETEGQRSGLTVGGRRSWPLLGPRAGELGSRQGGYPGVGPFAAADLGGRWSPGQSWPQACGSGPEAGPPTWPPDAPGQRCPPGVRGRLSAEAKAPALTQLWPVQAWVGRNLSPPSPPAAWLHFPKPSPSEGCCPGRPTPHALIVSALGPSSGAPHSRLASPACSCLSFLVEVQMA